MIESKFLNYAEAAAYVRVPIGTLRAMVHRKAIPHVRIGPRSVTFRRESLDAWIAEREHPAHDQDGSAR